MIRNFEDFCRELNMCGFSIGGGNAKGIFALIDYDWLNQDMLDTPVKWHCGDPEVDPWEWRMRVLEERTDIAYSKVFFKTSGFITRDWYPYFYAVRRNGESFEDAYERGGISHTAKRIYDIVRDGYVALHEIKALGGFGKEDKSQFDRAMVELQMGLFITMTGRKQKKNKYGIEYGWNSTVFTTVENFWAERDFEIRSLDAEESYAKLREQIPPPASSTGGGILCVYGRKVSIAPEPPPCYNSPREEAGWMCMKRARTVLIAKIEAVRAEMDGIPDCPEKEQMEELLREMERITEERLG